MLTSFTNLQKLLNQVLRKYHCGFDGDSPKICCPLQSSNEMTEKIDAIEPTNFSNYIIKNLNLLTKDCGHIEPYDKIYQGHETGPFDFPWMVLLSYSTSKFLCC